MEDRQIEQSIVKTIVFFDMFDYPLTAVEVFKWLDGTASSLKQIDLLLSSSEYIKERVTSSNGFYFLSGRDEIVSTRLDRFLTGHNKFKIINRGIRLIKSLPFVRFIGLANSIGSNNIRQGSDIDLLVVTKSGRLYLTRFLVTAILNLFRLRRHDGRIIDRLCLSFYITDDNLNLSKIKSATSDHYLSYWLANLTPVYDRHCYSKILSSNHQLLSRFKNFSQLGFGRVIVDGWFNRLVYQTSEFFLEGWFGSGLEWIFSKIQILKMSYNNKSLARCDDTRVVINNKMLKFHENDRRQYYNDSYDRLVFKII
jgi:hypothetical protein